MELLISAYPGISYDIWVIDYEDIPRLLATIGKDRRWLAKKLKLSDNTIRQYLGPKGKRTVELMEEIEKILTLESARQSENQPDAPPWNQIFRTADEFDRADRASRLVKAESLKDFCRNVILERADEILAQKSRSSYKKVTDFPASQVAEGPDKKGV
jgi:ParB-like chromosome segregation protein Spo0J